MLDWGRGALGVTLGAETVRPDHRTGQAHHVDRAAFYGLEPTDDPSRWVLPVTPGICSGLGTLFGGCALGAAVEALEAATGRRLTWAAAQFVSFARPPEVVTLTLTTEASGRSFTQARVVGRVDDRVILHVAATLGGRGDGDLAGTWVQPPSVAAPDEGPRRPSHPRLRGTITERFEIRLAVATDGSGEPSGVGEPGAIAPGRSAFWVRTPDLDAAPSTLALLGDLVPAGIGPALGERVLGSSLDNTVRVLRSVPAAWYLVDVRLHGIEAGVCHGLAHLWNERGELLGTASQATVVRRY